MQVVKVDNLSKLYHLGARSANSLRDALAGIWKNRGTDAARELWALRDVTFEVKQGETLGIIGRNGAGKSTLLKILSRITKPTSGTAEIRGRVSSLLEVGTGFHSELTGRENIYLNGAILGMKRTEINRKFDEIVDFSEIEKFLDTPVKHYSSGMYMRLAFAVAAHLEPEILIVDEVLAVGDAAFQKKCLGKMNDVSRSGRTIIFVSHQMGSIAHLCQTSILLENGKLILKDATPKVISSYLALNQNSENFYQASDKDKTKSVYFDYVKMVNENGEVITSLEHDKPLTIEFNIKANNWVNDLTLGFSLQDATQKRIFTIHYPLNKIIRSLDKLTPIRLVIPGNFLTPGHYSWIVATFVQGKELIDAQWNICGFNIVDAGTEFAGYEGIDYGCIFVHEYSFEPAI